MAVMGEAGDVEEVCWVSEGVLFVRAFELSLCVISRFSGRWGRVWVSWADS